jgi:histidinol-phosphate aminotransferase
MSRFLNSKYQKLEAYTPGEQPTDKKYIKLNTNESPYPPSQSVLEAVNREEVESLNLYSDPTCKRLKASLAELFSVQSENIFVSNGSDDILNFSFMAFCEGKQRRVKFPEISYGFYSVYAELHGVDYDAVPLCEDFSININDYCNNDATVVIANPNAPTGLALSKSEVEMIVKSNPDQLVLIDEAYVDFGGESARDLTKKYDNLLVVSTYSKSRSLAGARLGFAIGNKDIIADLEKIKYSTNPYNINRLTLVAGEAAVRDNQYYMDNCERIIKTREYTQNELRKLGFFVTDSKANFIFAKSDKIGGEELYLNLKSKGILVRHFTTEKIKEFNRITVGTPEQMNALLVAITEILEEK